MMIRGEARPSWTERQWKEDNNSEPDQRGKYRWAGGNRVPLQKGWLPRMKIQRDRVSVLSLDRLQTD